MIDTDVLIDIQTDDDEWRDWSYDAVVSARMSGAAAASVIVVGELATDRGTLSQITGFVAELGLAIEPFTAAGAFEAGSAHRAYRKAGGTRIKLLGDFLIGGHAAASRAALITRDPRRYRRYFPDLVLITPEKDDD